MADFKTPQTFGKLNKGKVVFGNSRFVALSLVNENEDSRDCDVMEVGPSTDHMIPSKLDACPKAKDMETQLKINSGSSQKSKPKLRPLNKATPSNSKSKQNHSLRNFLYSKYKLGGSLP